MSAGKVVQSFEPIDWFIHRNHNDNVTFLKLTTTAGKSLQLTDNHLLPVIPCDLDTKHMDINDVYAEYSVFSRKIQPGHCLLTDDGVETVATVESLSKPGYYSPVTESGTIIVNGVHASCFSSVESHKWQKTMFGIMRYVYGSIGYLFKGTTDSLMDIDIPYFLQYCLKASATI